MIILGFFHYYQVGKQVNEFSGEYDFLDIDYPVEFKCYGNTWTSVREAYNALSVEFNTGDDLKGRLAAMGKIIYFRFIQKDTERLLDTNNDWFCNIVKDHDNFWHKCSCITCVVNEADNYYGRLLMEVRERIRWERRRKNIHSKQWKSIFFK